jgi:hypothetical protein
MIYFYFLIVTGVFFVLFGFFKLVTIFDRMHNQLSQFEKLSETTHYADLQELRQELDELNYSYYELLADLSDRLDETQTQLERLIHSDEDNKKSRPQISNLPLDSKVEDNLVKPFKPFEDERTRVIRLVEQGFNDSDIAKILQIGTGKVTLLRKLEEHKK